VRTGVALMLLGGAGSQAGAGIGAHAFPAIGPPGVAAVRQLVAALVLLPVARPPLLRMTWPQWWPCLLLAAVFSVMNLSLYTAVDRIGLGLAVTLEFLGPLAVALLGSRTRTDLLTALAAAVGVYVLVLPGPVHRLARRRARPAGRRVLGGVHRPQPAGRQPAARSAGTGGGDRAGGAGLPPGGRGARLAGPADRAAAVVRRRRRCAVVHRPVRR
jgi:drug/metabolite transporter (DMT)-like permease